MLRKRTSGLFAVAVIFLTSGYSGGSEDPTKKPGKVSGEVTYAGYTLPVGILTFHPETGKAVSVELKNGKYTLGRIPRGRVIVTINTALHRQAWEDLIEQKRSSGGVASGKLRPRDKPKDKKSPEEEGREKHQDEAWERIKDMIDVPSKFADPKTSGLTYTIQSGSQTININIPFKERNVKKKRG